MAIKYSLGLHWVDPNDTTKGKKVYPRIQYNQIITLDKLAHHIHTHGSPFNEAVIQGVLMEMVSCIHEHLVEGNRVQLGDLGSLQATLRSKGVDKPEDFDPEAHVEAIEVNWTPSEQFKDLKNEPGIEWEYTLTRKEMKEAKKQSKQELADELEAIPKPDPAPDQKPDQKPGTGDGGIDE